MLSRILDSPWLYFWLAAVLFVAAIASQVEIRLPARSVGSVDDIAALKSCVASLESELASLRKLITAGR